MESRWTDSVITKLAKKYKLKKETIRLIIMSQFETVKDQIVSADRDKGYYPTARLPLLGIFKVRDSRQEFYNRGTKKRSEKEKV